MNMVLQHLKVIAHHYNNLVMDYQDHTQDKIITKYNSCIKAKQVHDLIISKQPSYIKSDKVHTCPANTMSALAGTPFSLQSAYRSLYRRNLLVALYIDDKIE